MPVSFKNENPNAFHSQHKTSHSVIQKGAKARVKSSPRGAAAELHCGEPSPPFCDGVSASIELRSGAGRTLLDALWATDPRLALQKKKSNGIKSLSIIQAFAITTLAQDLSA